MIAVAALAWTALLALLTWLEARRHQADIADLRGRLDKAENQAHAHPAVSGGWYVPRDGGSRPVVRAAHEPAVDRLLTGETTRPGGDL